MLYHSKAGFLRIGNENAFCPLSIEMGLEMVAQFGGNAYRPIGDSMVQIPTEKNLKGFWHALSALMQVKGLMPMLPATSWAVG